MNKDIIGITLACIGACVTSILAHLEYVTDEDHKEIEKLYDQILKLQEKIVTTNKRQRVG